MEICGQSIIVLPSSSHFQLASTRNPSQGLQSSTYCLSVGPFYWGHFVWDRLSYWRISHWIYSFMNCSKMGPSPWLQSSRTFPMWVLPMGCSPSAAYCTSMGLSLAVDHQENSSCMGFSPWDAAPARSLFQCGVSRACIFLQHISTCCGTGSSMGPTVVVYSNGNLNELQEVSCVSIVFTTTAGESLLLHL